MAPRTGQKSPPRNFSMDHTVFVIGPGRLVQDGRPSTNRIYLFVPSLYIVSINLDHGENFLSRKLRIELTWLVLEIKIWLQSWYSWIWKHLKIWKFTEYDSYIITHITFVFDFISVFTRATCLKLYGIVRNYPAIRETGNTLVIV